MCIPIPIPSSGTSLRDHLRICHGQVQQVWILKSDRYDVFGFNSWSTPCTLTSGVFTPSCWENWENWERWPNVRASLLPASVERAASSDSPRQEVEAATAELLGCGSRWNARGQNHLCRRGISAAGKILQIKPRPSCEETGKFGEISPLRERFGS